MKKLLPPPKTPFLFQQQRGKALQLKPAFGKAEPGQKQRMVNTRLGVHSRGEFLSHGFPWMLLMSMRASGSQPTHRSLSQQQHEVVEVMQGTVAQSQPAGPALHWAVRTGPHQDCGRNKRCEAAPEAAPSQRTAPADLRTQVQEGPPVPKEGLASLVQKGCPCVLSS